MPNCPGPDRRLSIRIDNMLESRMMADPGYIDGGTRPGSGLSGLIRTRLHELYGLRELPDGRVVEIAKDEESDKAKPAAAHKPKPKSKPNSKRSSTKKAS